MLNSQFRTSNFAIADMASSLDYKPMPIHDASPPSEQYHSPHGHPYSYQTYGSPPPTSLPPMYASPHPSYYSPSRPEPQLYELPAVAPVSPIMGGRPALGLGLNIYPGQAQNNSSSPSSPMTHLSAVGSVSPNPSELYANMSTRRPERAELSGADSARWCSMPPSPFP